MLGLDFETTGIDRFNDVPVSYALVSVVEGVVVRSWSGLIDPGREIPPEATAVHGISTERARDEGMPLPAAISLVSDAVVAASARGVPLAGMKLDYDLTILETQARDLFGCGSHRAGMVRAGARRRRDRPPLRPRPRRAGARSPTLCGHYGIEIGTAPTTPRRTRPPPSRSSSPSPCAIDALWECDLAQLHRATRSTGTGSGRESYDSWRLAEGMIPIDPRDYVWPVAPAVLPAA